MESAERLEELLCRIARTPHSEVLECEAEDAGAIGRGWLQHLCAKEEGHRYLTPLLERDLLTVFDSSGKRETGAHSTLLRYLLRSVPLDLEATVERWVPEYGWLLSTRSEGRSLHCIGVSPKQLPRRELNVALILQSAASLLKTAGSKLRPVRLRSCDQVAWVALLPEKVLVTAWKERLLSFAAANGSDAWARPMSAEEVALLLGERRSWPAQRTV